MLYEVPEEEKTGISHGRSSPQAFVRGSIATSVSKIGISDTNRLVLDVFEKKGVFTIRVAVILVGRSSPGDLHQRDSLF